MNEEMCDFEKVIEYINNLTFKRKIIGGVDKEDVYTCIQKLNFMYCECINNINNTHCQEMNRLQEALDREREKEQEYTEKIDLLTTAVLDVKKNKETILQQAEVEAQQMKEQTLDEVEHIVEEKTEEINQQRKQAQIFFDELNIVKDNSVENLNTIVSGLNKVFEQISSFQEKLQKLPDVSSEIFSTDQLGLEKGEKHEPDSEE